MTEKWIDRFLSLAKEVSTWSKDPSAKVGAVIVDQNKRIVSIGFNGFAAKVPDNDEYFADRDRKLASVLHAEMNSILFADRCIEGCSIFVWPFPPCALCTSMIIQKGITEVYCPNNKPERWASSFAISEQDFKDAKVKLIYR